MKLFKPNVPYLRAVTVQGNPLKINSKLEYMITPGYLAVYSFTDNDGFDWYNCNGNVTLFIYPSSVWPQETMVIAGSNNYTYSQLLNLTQKDLSNAKFYGGRCRTEEALIPITRTSSATTFNSVDNTQLFSNLHEEKDDNYQEIKERTKDYDVTDEDARIQELNDLTDLVRYMEALEHEGYDYDTLEMIHDEIEDKLYDKEMELVNEFKERFRRSKIREE